MDILDQAVIFRYHRQQLTTFDANTFGAVGWLNEAGQTARFNTFLSMADLNDCSVLDVGCGNGAFRKHLFERYPDARYLGIEMIPEFLQAAIATYGEMPETLFFEGDFSSAQLPFTDYIFASGVFNYRTNEEEYLTRMITKLFNNCRTGFGFNLLSQTVDNIILKAYNPDKILAFCQTLTSHVQLLNDYWENDFTILMYK